MADRMILASSVSVDVTAIDEVTYKATDDRFAEGHVSLHTFTHWLHLHGSAVEIAELGREIERAAMEGYRQAYRDRGEVA